jgi:hypothetical protein
VLSDPLFSTFGLSSPRARHAWSVDSRVTTSAARGGRWRLANEDGCLADDEGRLAGEDGRVASEDGPLADEDSRLAGGGACAQHGGGARTFDVVGREVSPSTKSEKDEVEVIVADDACLKVSQANGGRGVVIGNETIVERVGRIGGFWRRRGAKSRESDPAFSSNSGQHSAGMYHVPILAADQVAVFDDGWIAIARNRPSRIDWCRPNSPCVRGPILESASPMNALARQAYMTLLSQARPSHGHAIGVIAASYIVRAVARFAPPEIARLSVFQTDKTTLGFASALAVVAALAASVGPLIATTERRIPSLLSGLAASVGRAAVSARIRRSLVTVQLALALPLLSATGLLIRSVALLTRSEHLGFSPRGVVVATLSLLGEPFSVRARRQQILAEAIGRIEPQH